MNAEKLAVEGGLPVRSTPLPNVGGKPGRDIGEEELANLREVIETGKLFVHGGKFVSQFEREFAQLLGVKHAVACTSGTAAVHTAVGMINPNPGDEIITSPITDMGTIIGILAQNAIPVFADLDPRTYTLLPESVESCITDKTKAIVVVHLFGHPTDMDAIMQLADKYGLWVIEDCAQAYLAEDNGRLVGTIGHIGCFSLQQSKHMTTGDGGIIVTNDDHLAERARLFVDKGWPRHQGAPRGYLFLGMNYRMNELTGAVACAQLSKVRNVVDRRRAIADAITKRISDVPGVNPPFVRRECKHSWWLYPITIDESILDVTPKQFAKALTAEGIPAEQGYIGEPIYMSPLFQNADTCPYARPREYKPSDTPNAVEILRKVITIGCNEFFEDKDVNDISEAVAKVAKYYSRSVL
jgi:perosamine synthetase